MLNEDQLEALRETVRSCNDLIQQCAELANEPEASYQINDFRYMRALVASIALETRKFLLMADTEYYDKKEDWGGRTMADRISRTRREVDYNRKELSEFREPKKEVA